MHTYMSFLLLFLLEMLTSVAHSLCVGFMEQISACLIQLFRPF